jgi:hypothetical protein
MKHQQCVGLIVVGVYGSALIIVAKMREKGGDDNCHLEPMVPLRLKEKTNYITSLITICVIIGRVTYNLR